MKNILLLLLVLPAGLAFGQVSVQPGSVRKQTLPSTCTAGISQAILFKDGTADATYTCDDTGHYSLQPGSSTSVLTGDTAGPAGATVTTKTNGVPFGALATQNAPTSAQVVTGLGFTPQNAASPNSNNAGIGICTTNFYATGSAAGTTPPCSQVNYAQLAGTNPAAAGAALGTTAAQQAANLSDLANAATARINLGLTIYSTMPTVTGDGTLNATSGALTVSKIAGVVPGNLFPQSVTSQVEPLASPGGTLTPYTYTLKNAQTSAGGATVVQISSVTIGAAGTGYAVNDKLFISQTAATGGVLLVTSVGGSGTVTGVTLVSPGNGYSVASGLATSTAGTISGGGAGTGATINITAVTTPATAYTLSTSLGMVVNVNQFGTVDPSCAVGSLSSCADSSAAFQKAYYFASSQQNTCVSVPYGAYKLATPILITGSFCFLGPSGADTANQFSTLFPTGGPAFQQSAPMNTTSGFKLQHIAINGGTNSLDIGIMQQVDIQDVSLGRFTGWGLVITSGERYLIRNVFCSSSQSSFHATGGCISLSSPQQSVNAAIYAAAGLAQGAADEVKIDYITYFGSDFAGTGNGSGSYLLASGLGSTGGATGSSISNATVEHLYCQTSCSVSLIYANKVENSDLKHLSADNIGQTSGSRTVNKIVDIEGPFTHSSIDKLTTGQNFTSTYGIYFGDQFYYASVGHSNPGTSTNGIYLICTPGNSGELLADQGIYTNACNGTGSDDWKTEVSVIGGTLTTNIGAGINLADQTNQGMSFNLLGAYNGGTATSQFKFARTVSGSLVNDLVLDGVTATFRNPIVNNIYKLLNGGCTTPVSGSILLCESSAGGSGDHLQVASSGSGIGIEALNTGSSNRIQVGISTDTGTGGNKGINLFASTVAGLADYEGRPVVFYAGTAGSPSERMRVCSNGDIGIANSLCGSLFQIGSSGQASFDTSGNLSVPGIYGTSTVSIANVAGTTTIGTGSRNLAGSLASATTGTITFTLTFSTAATHRYVCSFHDETTVADVNSVNTTQSVAPTTTTLTATGTTVSGDIISYTCSVY